MKRIIIKNTSRYPDNAVRWLVNFAARYVRSEMERMGDLELFDRHGFYLLFRNKQFASFSGRYLCELVNERGCYPFGEDEEFRKVLVKIGTPKHFPLTLTDHRYNDMPFGTFNDWQECAVAITAHELSHVKFNGRKEGEEACDLIMHDAVEAFRKERESFDAAMAAGVRREDEKLQLAMAKKSPEAVLNRKLTDAQNKLARWTRKQKLANTKVKLYARMVKRLAAKQIQSATEAL